MITVFRRIIDLLGVAENTCEVCGLEFSPEEQGYICNSCLEEIKRNYPIEKKDLSFISDYFVFARYEGVLKEVLRLYKFKSVKPFSKILAEKIRDSFFNYCEEIKPDLITYVPVHIFRYWSRGFDHNREILKALNVSFENILIRVKHSKPLANIKGKEKRLKAVKGAYKVRKSKIDLIEGKKILIFDDIITTGSTAESVSEELMSLGADSVYFFFMAQEGS